MNCIVIGAGVTGLAASHQLLKRGSRVTILEARNRMGGRIYTFQLKNTSLAVESGAEFIHGEMPLTTALLKNAGVASFAASGEPFQLRNGQLDQREFFDKEWSLLLQKLHRIDRDMSFADFLQQNFQGEQFSELRKRAKAFAEGYNAASIQKASALALRDEWSKDENPQQLRPEGGYKKLVEALARTVVGSSGEIRLSEVVEAIDWKPGRVVVRTRAGKLYEAEKLLITVPIGVLQQASIQFHPNIGEYFSAARNIGFGPVVKFHLAFNESFWEANEKRKMKNLGFLFSDDRIPTWWTQLPDPSPILTGWLGGPAVHDLPRDDDELLNVALTSVCNLFAIPMSDLRDLLISSNVINWLADPFSSGAYSFVTLTTREARKILNTPVKNTLYFAGEALADGPHAGTVEAALSSANSVVKKIVSQSSISLHG